MARKKSLAGQLLKAYQDSKKAKAAEQKRLEQEQARHARAAEQEPGRGARGRGQTKPAHGRPRATRGPEKEATDA
ncbi:hypothetical protein, partial [Streptomyces sp. NPDC059479]|uniref:hypothetical protein n=1 Tax=Streptomyces sp. NPDC059479 TaxID=3346848 RepID=UPI00367C9CE9